MKKTLLALAAILVTGSAAGQNPASVKPEDRAEIEALVARYAEALGTCDAAGFADLFDAESGFFASGFRGHIVGRAKLMELVDSERHCRPAKPDQPQPQRRSMGVPTVTLRVDSGHVYGVADLGGAGQYQDEYVRTAQGWRFAARSVLTPGELAAGLDAGDLEAIQGLSADMALADHYAPDDNGVERFLSSGVVISVDAGTVRGRAYLDDGSHYDDVYDETMPGKWQIQSRELMPAQ